MSDKELAKQLAAALLSVENIPGVKLIETKMRVYDEQGKLTAIAYFNPDVWRNYGEDKLQVLVHRIKGNQVLAGKHYRVKGRKK